MVIMHSDSHGITFCLINTVPYFPHRRKHGDSKQRMSTGQNLGLLLLTSRLCSFYVPIVQPAPTDHKLHAQLEKRHPLFTPSRHNCAETHNKFYLGK